MQLVAYFTCCVDLSALTIGYYQAIALVRI